MHCFVKSLEFCQILNLFKISLNITVGAESIPFFRKLKSFENCFKKSKILRQKTFCFWLWRVHEGLILPKGFSFQV